MVSFGIGVLNLIFLALWKTDDKDRLLVWSLRAFPAAATDLALVVGVLLFFDWPRRLEQTVIMQALIAFLVASALRLYVFVTRRFIPVATTPKEKEQWKN